MVQRANRPPTQEEEDDLFMLRLEDDTEDAPWTVMGDLQFWSASAFAHSLRTYARQHDLPWYVASMLPIDYDWPRAERKKRLAPDTFVAFVPDHPRTSYNLAAEGQFPPYVLEVVSPSSTARDERDKRRAYDLLGAREYALFTPRQGLPSTLAGYRRGEQGRFVPWAPDDAGRLWSEVLGLYLVARDALLQAETIDGQLLLTPEQEAAARRAEAIARRRAEEERRRVQEENARLREQLARYRPPDADREPSYKG